MVDMNKIAEKNEISFELDNENPRKHILAVPIAKTHITSWH